jgi:hypothetical protein
MRGRSKVNVSEDFEKLFEFLNAHSVKALVVGGYAYTFHAKARYTKDIDIWVEPTPENAERVLQALQDFGFGSLPLTVEDFTEPGSIVQLGQPPQRVDFMTSLKSLSFDEAWMGRAEALYGKEQISYLGLDDLIRNKQAVARPQDRVDVRTLQTYAKRRRSRDKPE